MAETRALTQRILFAFSNEEVLRFAQIESLVEWVV